MLLEPKTAAQISKVLFPSEDPGPALVKLIQWFDEYVEARNASASHPSPLTTHERPGFTRSNSTEEKKESSPSVGLSTRPSNKQLQQMMEEVLAYAKAESLTASELTREIGASYPTILNWQRGKLPRGENVGRVQAFLEKIRAKK